MTNTSVKTSETVKKGKRAPGERKTRILIVNGHPAVREKLMQVINSRPDLGACLQVEDADHALGLIETQGIDFAILDISLEGSNSPKVAEKIKLHSPGLPILILSMQDEETYVECTGKGPAKRCIVKRKVTEQIVKAVCYVQSLVDMRLSGFTVLVKV